MNSLTLGYLAGIGYVLSTIFSMFCIEKFVDQFHNKYMVLFIASAISIAFFNILNFRYITKIIKASLFSSWPLYLALSLLIGVNWISSVFGVMYSNAFLYTLVYFIFSASLAHLDSFYNTKKAISIILVIISWILLSIVILINNKLFLGISIAILGGATGYFYRRVTIAFSKKEALTSTQIISTRFYPLMLVLITKFSWADIQTINMSQFYMIIIFSIISLIIPVFLNQIAIIKLGANKSTIISAFIFPVSWLIEEFLKHKIEININLFIALLATMIIILPTIYKFKIN